MGETPGFNPKDYLDGGKKALQNNNYAELKGLDSEKIKQIALARIAARKEEAVTIQQDKSGALQIVNLLNTFDKKVPTPIASAPTPIASAPTPIASAPTPIASASNNEILSNQSISQISQDALSNNLEAQKIGVYQMDHNPNVYMYVFDSQVKQTEMFGGVTYLLEGI